MIVNLIRRTVSDVNAAAVRLPSGDLRREMFVGVGDAAVMFFLERRAALNPELLDELLALLVGGESLERGALLVGDDVGHILGEPFPIGGGHRLPRSGFLDR